MIKSMYLTKHIAQFLLIVVIVRYREFSSRGPWKLVDALSLVYIINFHDTATLIAGKLSYHSCQSYKDRGDTETEAQRWATSM